MTQRLTADDLQVGDVFDLGEYTPTREEILRFAEEWDPLPHHIDEDAARAGHFGDVIASGVHTIAILQRLAVASVLSRWDVLAGISLRSVEFPNPVRPDRTLRGRTTVVSIDLTHPERGMVVKESVLTDPAGQVVLRATDDSYIWRRNH